MGLLGFFLLVYIAPLGIRPFFVPDEFRYAEIPREMLASGDWVVPRLNGLRYFEKPPLGYWINAASMALFGQNRFAARLPSAMAAGASALFLFFLVRRFGWFKGSAPLTAGIFLTFLEVYEVGTYNVLDSTFSLFVTAALVFFFFGYRASSRAGKALFLSLCGVACGLGFLTKGFIALVIPVVTVVPFLIWERKTKAMLGLFWIPLLCALLTVLPWGILIHLREPDFWHYFIWTEHIHRFLAQDAQHAKPFWFYLPVLIIGLLPWSVLSPAATLGLRKVPWKDPLIRFALCWLLFPFLFFSASHGKLPSYMLPCLAPFALFFALGLHTYLETGKTRHYRVGVFCLVFLIIFLALSLTGFQTGLFSTFVPYTETLKWVVLVAGILSWALGLLLSLRPSAGMKKLILYGAAPILVVFISHFVTPDLALEHKAPGDFLRRHAHRIRPDTVLVSDEDPLCAVSWLYHRSDVYLVGSSGELTYGLRYNEARGRLLDVHQLRDLVLSHLGTGRVTFIAKKKKYGAWARTLPTPLFEDDTGAGGFVFAQY